MLNFEPLIPDHDDLSKSTQIRHGQVLSDLITRASETLGVDKSVFLRSVIAREAQRILDASARHVLTAEDAAVFSKAMDAAPKPTPRAHAAADAYRRRVVYAD